MNLRFLALLLAPGLLAVGAAGDVPAVAGELAARDNAEPLSRWMPLHQAEPALAEAKLIRGLLNVRQSDCSGMYACGTGWVPSLSLTGGN